MVLLATSPDPAVAVAKAFFVGAVARALLDSLLLSRRIGWRWVVPRWSPESLLADLRVGAPTMGSFVVFAVFTFADRIFAAQHFSLQAAALYSFAADLHVKAFFLLWAVNSALYQPLVARHALSFRSRGLIYGNVGGAVLIAVLYYIPVAVFSGEIVTIWIDAKTALETTPIVWAMLPGSIAFLLASSLENSMLRTRGAVLSPMLVHGTMLLTLLIALQHFPDRFGLQGIGLAYSAANMVFLLGICILVAPRKPEL
jgi:O-antigen/teichoic acid export membrane protein